MNHTYSARNSHYVVRKPGRIVVLSGFLTSHSFFLSFVPRILDASFKFVTFFPTKPKFEIRRKFIFNFIFFTHLRYKSWKNCSITHIVDKSQKRSTNDSHRNDFSVMKLSVNICVLVKYPLLSKIMSVEKIRS